MLPGPLRRSCCLSGTSLPLRISLPVLGLTGDEVPTGRSAGSLQVSAVSPLRAAGLPLINTVALPVMICPLFTGGRWNAPPCGTCGGVLSAVLPCVAACRPMIFTLGLRPPLMIPLNGCGSGVGTVPLGEGTMTMWVSVPVIRSPCFAAGCPIALVQIDRRALDIHLALRLQRQVALRLQADVAPGFDAQRVVAGVQNAGVAARVFDRDAPAAVGVVEDDLVAGARADDPLLDLATAHDLSARLRRRVFAVPQAAQHIWVVDIAKLEADQHLVVDLGQKLDAPPSAAAHRDDARPVAGVLAREPGVLDLDPSQSVGVLVVGHNPDHQTAGRGCLALGEQQAE